MVGITLYLRLEYKTHLVSISLHQAHKHSVVLLVLQEQIENGIGSSTTQ